MATRSMQNVILWRDEARVSLVLLVVRSLSCVGSWESCTGRFKVKLPE